MAALTELFVELAGALDGDLEIERRGKAALLESAEDAARSDSSVSLPASIASVLGADDAHSCCVQLLNAPLPWAPPISSSDADYVEVSKRKVLVELIGPLGLVRRDGIRVGVYGIEPGVHYGVRTHPAEEVFVMLAGRADWLRDSEDFAEYGPGARRFHPSMMPHATRTRDSAFMSIYVWSGDVSYDNYVYSGTGESQEQ